MIDEHCITAQIPSKTLPGSNFDLDVMLPVIKQARIWWHINKTYTRLKIYNSGLADILTSIYKLETELEQSLRELPPRLQPPDSLSEPTIAPENNIVHYLGIIFSNLGALIQIHSIFVYPWNRLENLSDDTGQLEKHRRRSTNIVVNSSRTILRHLPFIKVNATTPKW